MAVEIFRGPDQQAIRRMDEDIRVLQVIRGELFAD
jgi:hypothetical protein